MLDLFGTLAIGATAAAIVTALGATLRIGLAVRIAIGAIAGAWVALIAVLAASGTLAKPIAVPILFVVPLTSVALSALRPQVRAALLAIPSSVIVALNVFRVQGVVFLVLAAGGSLGGPFPYFAGIGDVVTGLFALNIARVVAKRGAGDRRVLVWNAFGTLDLIVAVTLATLSAPGSPLHLIRIGAGSAALFAVPYALIPLALVPAYLIGHAIVFAQARAGAAARTSGPVIPSPRHATMAG